MITIRSPGPRAASAEVGSGIRALDSLSSASSHAARESLSAGRSVSTVLTDIMRGPCIGWLAAGALERRESTILRTLRVAESLHRIARN